MRKILALCVMLAMVLVAVPALKASEPCPCCDATDWSYTDCHNDISTTALVVGGGGGGGSGGGGQGTGFSAPIIKCKWEYDMDVTFSIGPCCPDPQNFCDQNKHDACPTIPGLQVKPIPGDDVTVGYYAIVTDPQGLTHIDTVYVDVWHPNGEFKYQFSLTQLSKADSIAAWNHVKAYHHDLVTYSGFSPTDPKCTQDDYIAWELNESKAAVFYGEAKLSYCQPAGNYCVGVRAVDYLDMWSDYLFNTFWYIPTAAVQLDFTNVNYGQGYGVVQNYWGDCSGDTDMGTSALPTVKNIGNTPVYFTINQDDMHFGKNNGQWNVEYQARLSANGVLTSVYKPNEDVTIPGYLGMCTQEKFDFYIHVLKSFPGFTGTGYMNLCAHIYGAQPDWISPLVFDPAPGFVDQTNTVCGNIG